MDLSGILGIVAIAVSVVMPLVAGNILAFAYRAAIHMGLYPPPPLVPPIRARTVDQQLLQIIADRLEEFETQ